MTAEIQVGDKVRSFDFPMICEDGKKFGFDLEGENAAYIEGTVVAIHNNWSGTGCDHYEVIVEKDVLRGADNNTRVGRTYFPPKNGTASLMGTTCGVVKL